MEYRTLDRPAYAEPPWMAWKVAQYKATVKKPTPITV